MGTRHMKIQINIDTESPQDMDTLREIVDFIKDHVNGKEEEQEET
jgi:hemerythrin-like domain-containing protein